jgi:hypothetical protein
MRTFAESVYLSPNIVDDILEPPRQKFFYPPGNLPRYVVETTSLRFRLAQDPTWIFELQRHDTIYPHPPALRGARFGFSEPKEEEKVVPCWGASLYHQEWITMFGENAALKAGEMVSWKPTLTGFFPPSPDVPDPDIVTGDATFRTFWQIVESLMSTLNLKGENVQRAETKEEMVGRPGSVATYSKGVTPAVSALNDITTRPTSTMKRNALAAPNLSGVVASGSRQPSSATGQQNAASSVHQKGIPANGAVNQSPKGKPSGKPGRGSYRQHIVAQTGNWTGM